MSYHKNQKYGLELRKYIPEDYEPVRQMFSNGIVEHAATAIFDGINGVKPKTRFLQQFICLGSYCGSVGRVVASNSRGPLFEYSHWQTFIFNIYFQLYSKDENEKKRPGLAHFLKQGISPRNCLCIKTFVQPKLKLDFLLHLRKYFHSFSQEKNRMFLAGKFLTDVGNEIFA